MEVLEPVYNLVENIYRAALLEPLDKWIVLINGPVWQMIDCIFEENVFYEAYILFLCELRYCRL